MDAVATKLRWSAHLSMLFAELPLLARPRAAYAAGFSLVESWWPGEMVDAWVDEVLDVGVSAVLVNADGGDLAAGERGFLNVPKLRERELQRIANAVAVAVRVGAPRVNVLVGRLTRDARESRQRADIVSVLGEAVECAAAAAVTLVVEPINRLDVPGYLVPTALDALALIEAVGSPRVRLLYDAYHAARSGSDPIREAPTLMDVIDHVQYADCPGRGAPGSGLIDLRKFRDVLWEAGYTGAIGLEYDPRGETVTLGSLPQ